MKTFINDGCGLCYVLKQSEIGSALIVAVNENNYNFVVPLALEKNGSWWQGHYFDDIDTALEYYNKLQGE